MEAKRADRFLYQSSPDPVLPYFIGGIALAALLSTVIPVDAIPKLVGGSSGPFAYLLAAVPARRSMSAKWYATMV